MSHLAAHYAQQMNGVSKTNAEVAEPLFPGRSIEGLTNGVHHRKWCLPTMAALFDRHLDGWRANPALLAQAATLPAELQLVQAVQDSLASRRDDDQTAQPWWVDTIYDGERRSSDLRSNAQETAARRPQHWFWIHRSFAAHSEQQDDSY